MFSFSKAVKEPVQRHPATITALAGMSRMSRPSFYDMINGICLPREHKLEAIFKALEFSVEEEHRFFDLYQSDKLQGHRGKQMEARSAKARFLNNVKRKLQESSVHLWSPKVGGPNFLFESRGMETGLVATARISDWEKALGTALAHIDAHGLRRYGICVQEPMPDFPEFLRLFKKHGIGIVSMKDLTDWVCGSNSGKLVGFNSHLSETTRV